MNEIKWIPDNEDLTGFYADLGCLSMEVELIDDKWEWYISDNHRAAYLCLCINPCSKKLRNYKTCRGAQKACERYARKIVDALKGIS